MIETYTLTQTMDTDTVVVVDLDTIRAYGRGIEKCCRKREGEKMCVSKREANPPAARLELKRRLKTWKGNGLSLSFTLLPFLPLLFLPWKEQCRRKEGKKGGKRDKGSMEGK